METITFINTVRDSSKVSEYSRDVLKDIMRSAGITNIKITSTARTAQEQARIMFSNLETYGVAHQKKLYGSYGDTVIDEYVNLKAGKKSDGDVIAGMVIKINGLGARKVSRHAGDPSKINVVDIAPSSINLAVRKKFEAAVQAESRVSKFFSPPKDPAYHLEIPQESE